MRSLLLRLIACYRRHLSPLKGFRCAYRVHTGRASCSGLGMRAIRRYGSIHGIAVLRRRLYLCGVAHRRYGAVPVRVPLGQRGACDFGCDMPCDINCDLPGGRSCTHAGDCGSCDWPGGDRRQKSKHRAEEETQVRLPPPVRPSG